MDVYDIIIIGAGSAGMSAAIYAKRFGMKTLVIGKVVGGLLNDSHNVENYPGFPSIPGFDLMMRFKEHVESLSIPIKEEWVETVTKNDDGTFSVKTEKERYTAKTILIATGTKHRHLGVPGEERLAGKGVSYCATCDAAFFKGKDVAIVGGGDSAAQAANLLAQHASHVYVIVRKDHMRAEPLNRERLEQNEKVDILYETKVVEVLGENSVEKIKLTKPFKGSDELAVQGFFVEIGADVQSELAKPLGVERNERGEIIIDAESRTNVEGVYAAGDVGNRKFKQAITGAAEGCIAAFSAYDYLQRKEHGREARFGY
ncbi:FAD-binding protein [Candidatus Woesearchaeota archaeon]|nr:MAG: FAD-binding protein [Candidatus Woesearchaeota archaeon]